MPVVTVKGLEGYDSILRNEVAGVAGFPADDREKLMLVAEPEAAAVYWQVRGCVPGARFTVVDAGGVRSILRPSRSPTKRRWIRLASRRAES